MQYQSVIDKLKKQCKVKNNTKFKMKLGVSFDDLPAYDATYHLKCFNTLWETANLTKPVQCISIVLNLVRQIDPLLNEAWLLSMANLLNQLKSILKDSNYELFDSYSSARLKQHLIKYYSLEICFGEEQGKNIQISLFTVCAFQLRKSSILLQIIKEN